jgi:hypothetical protein
LISIHINNNKRVVNDEEGILFLPSALSFSINPTFLRSPYCNKPNYYKSSLMPVMLLDNILVLSLFSNALCGMHQIIARIIKS